MAGSAFSLDIDFGPIQAAYAALGKINDAFTASVEKLGSVMNVAFAVTGVSAINMAIKASKNLKMALADVNKPLLDMIRNFGEIFSTMRNILMLPFNIMTQAFNAIKDASGGANERNFEAKKLRTSGVDLKELDWAEKYVGSGGAVKDALTQFADALNNADNQGIFAALGLDPKALQKMNATDALAKYFEKLQERFKGRDFDSMESRAEYEQAGFGNIMDHTTARVFNNGMFDEVMKQLARYKASTGYSEKAMRALEKGVVNTERAFENLKLSLVARFGPAFMKILNALMRVGEQLVNKIFTDDRIKALEKGLNKMIDGAAKFINSDNFGSALEDGINFLIEMLRTLALGIAELVIMMPGVNEKTKQFFSDFRDEYLKSPEERAKQEAEERFSGKARTGSANFLSRVLNDSNARHNLGLTSKDREAAERKLFEFMGKMMHLEAKEKGVNYEKVLIRVDGNRIIAVSSDIKTGEKFEKELIRVEANLN